MRWTRLWLSLGLLLVLVVGAQAVGNLGCSTHLRHDQTLMANGHAIEVQTATSEVERNKGLSGQPCISGNEGMLFVFDKPGYYPFWMKDMHFSLDFLWLNSDKQIVTELQAISPSSYPKTYVSDKPAKYVLELPAGRAAALGLAKGQQLSF